MTDSIKYALDGGMLSDQDVRTFWGKGINIFTSEGGELAFDLDKQLQLASIDLRFRHECKRICLNSGETLTYEKLKQHSYTESFEVEGGKKLKINPGEIILTTTLETIQLSEEFAGIISGRSSIARLGIMVHCCQEYINPGHGQPIPLQIVNLSPYEVELDLNIPICQLVLFKLRTPSTGKYSQKANAKYADEINPETSKIYTEMKETSSDAPVALPKPPIMEIIQKYLGPFLPTLIMFFIGYPFLEAYINGTSVLDIANILAGMPLSILIGIGCLCLFIGIKKGEKK